MELDQLFWAAFQGSLVLGLVHGVNPCGHSWLVLAPFVVGQKQGGRVALFTFAFVAGTAAACLLLGVTLGSVSAVIPASMQFWVDVATSALLILLGLALIIKPGLLHHHHDDEHGHDHDHAHGHDHHHPSVKTLSSKQQMTGMALFGIGFVNMIIPCPTVAIMYGYALDSASAIKATIIFGIYAIGTAVAVGTVIYAIFRVSRLLDKLSQDWVETALMRSAGLVTALFAGYSLFTHLQ